MALFDLQKVFVFASGNLSEGFNLMEGFKYVKKLKKIVKIKSNFISCPFILLCLLIHHPGFQRNKV
jgi:hypothetical protein